MRGVLTGVSSKFSGAIQIDNNPTWLSFSKFHLTPANLVGFNKGETVEYELAKGKYVTKLEHTSNTPWVPTEAVEDVMDTSSPAQVLNQADDRSNKIVRQAMVKAVLMSPVLAEVFKGRDQDSVVVELNKLIESYTLYSNTGKFEVVENPKVVA